ncbi:MAG TPA: hypothetical protein VGL14_03620 [Methylomirabilota bacterium]|jgi:hypothetical protein
MDMNEYALETLARERLAELRAIGERATRLRVGTPASRPRRVVRNIVVALRRRLYGRQGEALTAFP